MQRVVKSSALHFTIHLIDAKPQESHVHLSLLRSLKSSPAQLRSGL